MKEAVARDRARRASIVFVPPPFAADAIMEAADAGIQLLRLHHRRHPDPGHDAGQALHASLPSQLADAPDRPQLRRDDHARGSPAGHHAGPHLPAWPRRASSGGQARSATRRQPAEGARHRRLDQRRDRRRPGQRLVVPRHPRALRGGRRDRRGDDDRRDRRAAGGRGCGLRPRPHEQAGDRLHRWPGGPQGPQDGPCGRHRVGCRRVGAGEGRDPARLRHHRRTGPLEHGHYGRRGLGTVVATAS